MTTIDAVDVEGAMKAYLSGYPGLTGSGNPLAGGVHLGHPRLPASGAIAEFQVASPRTLDDISDTARIQVRVRAAGKAARTTAEAGCRAVALAVLALCGPQVVVVTGRGDIVKLLVAAQSNGPTMIGDPGGEVVYGFDFSVRAQNLNGTYGAGAYGAGPYGG